MCDEENNNLKIDWSESNLSKMAIDFPNIDYQNLNIYDSNRPTKWDYRFLRLAQEVSSWSKDPSTKVGAVTVKPNKTINGFGFNGFPRGVSDRNLNDRDYKYPRVVHAELNAILNSGQSVIGDTMYCTLAPCSQCSAAIIQSGISKVIHIQENYDEKEHWHEAHKVSIDMFVQAGVKCYGLYLKNERKGLHAKFISNPA